MTLSLTLASSWPISACISEIVIRCTIVVVRQISRVKTSKAIFWSMWRNVVRNRYISGDPHFSDFQIFCILTLSWSKQRNTFGGYEQFARDPKITGFSDLSGIEMVIRRSKNRSDGMLKKDVKFMNNCSVISYVMISKTLLFLARRNLYASGLRQKW